MAPINTLLSKDEQSVQKQSSQRSQQSFAPTASPIVQRTGIDISTLNPTQVFSLQRSIGNRAVNELLSSSRSTPVTPHSSAPDIQPKLKVGPVGDAYEQEADRMAAQVVNSPSTQQPVQRAMDVQDVVQMKPASNTIQRYDEEDELEGDEVEGEELEEEEDYIPSNREVKKEIGLRRRLGWRAAHKGARFGDWAMNKFRANKRNPLRERAESGMVNTVVSARNRLHQKHDLKDLSKAERKQVLRAEREWNRKNKKEFKERERPGMVNL